MSTDPAQPRPSATLILLRDGTAGLEVLMVRRAATIAFYGGAWAFPGGRVEPSDCAEGEGLESLPAVKRAAAREVLEEVSVEVAPEQMTWMSFWVTPVVRPKRFKTWFFIAEHAHADVVVDGSEVDAHRWLTFDEAFAAHRAREMELPPPTFVTLTELARFRTAAEAIAAFARTEPTHFLPKLVLVEGGAVSLYQGDAGYEQADAGATAPRHRLTMIGDTWRYHREQGTERPEIE